jgi:hypothetical protein
MVDDNDGALIKAIKKLLEDYPRALQAALSKLRSFGEEDIHTQMDGTLSPELEKENDPPSRSKRNFLSSSTGKIICTWLWSKDGITTAVVGGVILDNIIHKNDEFKVTPKFLSEVIINPYDMKGLHAKILPNNMGEQSILSSLRNHANGPHADEFLQNNLINLERIIDSTDNYDVKSYVTSRWATDLFRLGRGDEAFDALNNIDPLKINSPQVRSNVLEYSSSLFLSLIKERDFLNFSDRNSKKLVWMAREHIDDLESHLSEKDSNVLGVSISAAIQAKYISKFQSGEINASSAATIHREWAAYYRLGAETYLSGNQADRDALALSYASDYIYSLTRVAYHAAAWGNYDLAFDITDWAIGKGQPDDSTAIKLARDKANKELKLNVRWMWLLRKVLAEKFGRPILHPTLAGLALNPGSAGHPLQFAIQQVAEKSSEPYRSSTLLRLPEIKAARSYITTLLKTQSA